MRHGAAGGRAAAAEQRRTALNGDHRRTAADSSDRIARTVERFDLCGAQNGARVAPASYVAYSGLERRDLKLRTMTSARLMGALSSPSIVLTVDEAQRLLGLAREACERILKRLENSGVLRQLRRGEYVPGPLISGIPRP